MAASGAFAVHRTNREGKTGHGNRIARQVLIDEGLRGATSIEEVLV